MTKSHLAFKSGYLPKALGVLFMIGGLGLLIESFQHFLLPSYKAISYPGVAVATLAEIALCLWLLVKGVKIQQP